MRPIAVVGPQDALSDGVILDQCAIANIPHIQATWQPLDPDMALNDDEADEGETNEEAAEEEEEEPTFKKISINFYPSSDEISLAYAALLKYYKWENFAVLYEDDFGNIFCLSPSNLLCSFLS